MMKLLATGKTDLLDKFVSMRTRRPFKAYLAWNAEEGKVSFEFEPSKFPRKGGAARSAAPAKAAAKKAPAKKAASKTAAAKKPRKAAAGLTPSPELAAVIGGEPVARTEVIKKIWDYIKAQGLQDPKDKRSVLADAKLQPVFGKDRVTMFEITGLVGKHLS
jgi:DNA topoisomerase-3